MPFRPITAYLMKPKNRDSNKLFSPTRFHHHFNANIIRCLNYEIFAQILHISLFTSYYTILADSSKGDTNHE